MSEKSRQLMTLFLFLFLILFIGPRVYVFMGIPVIMKPVNYYDFLNSALLMLITYELLIKK
tara:strand:+ start:1801 stop:1983 length:183 start_codon:yes stop_codon:yes gene_type:complete